jgi:hypothetical protein
MNFSTKVVNCDNYTAAVAQIETLEYEWIWALLSRFNVDEVLLERAKNDPSYPKYEWRDYLLSKFGLQIEKDFGSKKTTVKRTSFKKGETIVVGEWRRPILVRVMDGSKAYQLHLDYFSLV